MAYKMAMGATPFQLVYGLNVIVPIEFVVPTLHVDIDLQWIGNELSKQVDELNKLDEMRLLAIAIMYAKKWCCKH